jgi:hypothetical protein
LHGQDHVVHVKLTSSASVLGIYTGVREDLCGVSVRKFQQLVQNAGLHILNARSGREEESDGSGGARQVFRWPGGRRDGGHGRRDEPDLCVVAFGSPGLIR